MLRALTAKQKEYIREASKYRWAIKHGATRSGKTYLDYYLIPMRLRENEGKEGLNVLLGATKGTLSRNIIQPMQALWGENYVSSINSNNTCKIFGYTVYALGANKSNSVDMLRGSSIKYCYGDEVATWNGDTFEMLKSRLDKPYSHFDGTTNPRGPSHWLKEFIDSDADIFAQHYSIDDNDFLDPVVKAEMKKEYTGVFYDRYIRGLWVLAEGLVYPNYQDALEEMPENAEAEETVLSIDYGTQNPFAALLWKKHKGVWYAVKEYYYSGRETGRQKTDAEYGDDLDFFIKNEYKPRFYGDIGIQKMKVIIDPSAASFIALLRKKPWAKVIPADNDVLDGIRETATAMQTGLIKISPRLKNMRKEFESYVWDETSVEDRPVKEFDHCLTGETLVDTVDGQVPIKDLCGKTGMLWAWDGAKQRRVKARFDNVHLTRRQAPVYEVETEDGRTFRATGDHKVLTVRGWVETFFLKKTDRIKDLNGVFRCVRREPIGWEDVYDLTVDEYHNFSIEGGLIVHNCMDAARYFCKTMRIVKPHRMLEADVRNLTVRERIMRL